MGNIQLGIFTILLATIGYFYSWRYQKKDQYQIAVLLLMLSGFALRLFVAGDFFLHIWDERYHALVAKNFIQHPLLPTLYDHPILAYNYQNWGGNHIWLHKQPLPMWMMAFSMQLFGVNEIALRLPSIVMSTIAIGLSYCIGSKLFHKKTGYIAAFLFSINGLIIELTGGRVPTDHIDISFMFFILLAIFFSAQFAQKRTTAFNILAGISIGFAILSKWLPALIVLPIWLLLVIDSGHFTRKKLLIQFLLLNITLIAVALPWQLYIFHAFPKEAIWETTFNVRHLSEGLEGQARPFYYFIDRIRINYGDLIYLPLAWFLWKSIANFADKKRLLISIWVIIPLIFFSLAQTKMQGYMLFTAPALFIITADFFSMLSKYKSTHQPKWLINIILVLLIALPIRYSIERIKPFEKMERKPQWVQELKKMKNERPRKTILFNYPNPIEAMFYTDITAYDRIPDKKTIINLLQQDYTIIINEKGDIPRDIASLDGIIIKHIASAE